MKLLGILFNEIIEEEVKEILKNNIYFFKLIFFCKNIKKDSSGNYNFEFFVFFDFVILDMWLRYILLFMCLDIEYLLKIDIFKKIIDDVNEDGYIIV